MAASLHDQVTRRQVFLERYKAEELRRLDAFLRDIDRALRERLGRAGTAFQRDRIEGLLTEVGTLMEAIQRPYQRDLFDRLRELATHEADLEARSLAGLPLFQPTVPPPAQLHAAVFAAPLGARGAGGGLLLEAFVSRWAENDRERVIGAIRRGAFEGRTTDQIIRDIRGTQARRFQDGILAVNRRAAATVVRTAVQHVATQARMETLMANADVLKGYAWSATLDARTSSQCRSLDGRVFELGKGPLPPAHPNCRSSIVPVTKSFRELGIDADDLPPGMRSSVDGPVDGTLTYYEWLKRQPRAFVEEALGPTRAALFLKGGIDADEFARLQLDRNFQPLTLEELRRLIPHVFERAGV